MTGSIFECAPWGEVTATGIRTTADGPFSEDVFWQLQVGDRVIEIPGALVEDAELRIIGDKLPGLDWNQVARAMGSTDERVFSLWDVDSPRRMADRGALHARFAELVARLGGGGDPAIGDAFDRLHTAWAGPQRRYHDLRHLAACLCEIDRAAFVPATADVIELALWYHDAIYEPGARDCEPRSADLLVRDAAALAIPRELAGCAADLVRATAHAAAPTACGDPATDLIVDIDLSILGRDRVAFLDYEYSVEEEYAAIPTAAFRTARGQFLGSLLATQFIFRTPIFRARYEERARANIRSLLDSRRYRRYVHRRWWRWGG
jgi:predicted metal-dependent HD superfamily phosphohydrolase